MGVLVLSDVCDPSWHLSRDGLIVSGLIVSSSVPIFTIVLPLVLSAAYYWCFHQKKVSKVHF